MLSSLRDNSSLSSGGRGVDCPMESSIKVAMSMSFSLFTALMSTASASDSASMCAWEQSAIRLRDGKGKP